MKLQSLVLPVLLSAQLLYSGVDKSISLAGSWRFQLDRSDAGQEARWFSKTLTEKVKVPVDLAAQGIGDAITLETRWTGDILDKSFFNNPEYAPYRRPGHIKVPFWLQPEKYYRGAAWYQRDVEIPAAWDGRRVVLFIERPHWETRVWLDGKSIGSQNALATPHVHDLGAGLTPGKHTLTIRIDNRLVINVGENSHSVSDHTQGNWNGMVGRIELISTPQVWIQDLQVYPSLQSRSVLVKGKIGNLTRTTGQGQIAFVINPGNVEHFSTVKWDSEGGVFTTEIALGASAVAWDEFHPFLYHLSASLNDGADLKKATFGMREISTQGTQFIINGRKTFIRGTLECAIFPKTGHPPTDVESWKRIIRIAKAHGLNNIRFHSWCPPDAAFVAADELGFYYQVECSSWANVASSTGASSLGDGLPVDAWLYEEADRILNFYGNHPSFILMPYGNEPGGKNKDRFLAKWVEHCKALDDRRLYSGASGWPKLTEDQFHVVPDPRIQSWGSGLKSRINAKPPETTTDYRAIISSQPVPVISHEIGQWCVYPNFAEMKKYTGYLKPKNFEIFYDRLGDHGMKDQAHQFLMASGKLQTLCYKEEIESALRTPGMGGFQLLDLHDFPGQGSALVGVLDPFWDEKGYVTAKEFRRFCSSTVLLARLSKRVFTADELLTADIEIAHFGPEPLLQATCEWKLLGDQGRVLSRGLLPTRDIPVDNGIALGSIKIDLNQVSVAGRYKLVLALQNQMSENDWDVWIYPGRTATAIPQDILIVHGINDSLQAALRTGGKALLFIPPARTAPDKKLGPVALGFSSIFWNTAWTNHQAPHTLGILCEPTHPALAAFPTEYHSNWQWWYLISQAGPLIMDEMPKSLRPIVQVIDDWFTARRLGLIFEARVGDGKLLVCSIDLLKDQDNNPVARQMLHSLLGYMNSKQFNPKSAVTIEQITNLVTR